MIQKYFTLKNCCICLGVVLLLSTIPLLGMAQYAYPIADDFHYGYRTHEAWVQTRSIIEVVKAGILNTIETYQGWQGTFFACFMMTLQPGIFGTRFYQIVPYLLIFSFVFANVLMGYTVFRRVLRGNNYCAFSLTFLLLIYSLQLVPHPSQSFYWYNGAIYYTFSHSLALIMFSCLLLCYTNKSPALKGTFVAIASLLSMCVGGSNYTTALLSAILFCVILVYVGVKKVDKWWVGILPALLCIVCLIASIFAPGNNVRRAQYQETSIIKALYISFLQAGQKITEWLTLPCLILMAASLPFIIMMIKKTNFTFRYPLLFIAGAFCCFSACFFPTAYTAEGALYERNADILFYTFAILILVCLYYAVGWLLSKNDALVELLNMAKDKAAVFVMLLLIGTVLYIWPGMGPQNVAGASALRSLVSGEAKAFGELMDERFAMLNDNNLEFVYLPAKYVRPWVLPQEDVNQDPTHWVNTGLARYYHKDAIYIVWQ